MSSLAETVQMLQDPALRREFTQLPLDRQMALQEELMGKVITDPDFQGLLQQDQTRAVGVLHDFRNSMPVPPLQAQNVPMGLEPPGSGFEPTTFFPELQGESREKYGPGPGALYNKIIDLAKMLSDPATWLEPENIGGGGAAARYLRAPSMATERGGKAVTEMEAAPLRRAEQQSYTQAPQATAPRGRLFQRYEEPGVSPSDISKPHGLYTSPAEIPSPHAELGGERTLWELSSDAKILHIEEYPAKEIAIRRDAIGAGAGVHAAKRLLGDEVFERLRTGTKSDAIAYANEHYPGPDYSRYYDKQEVIEAIGAQEARKRGYDAIDMPDVHKFGGDFSETVLLNPNKAKKITSAEFPPPEPPKAFTRPPTGALPPELGEQRVSLQTTADVKNAVIENVQALTATDSSEKGRRVMHQVVEALDTGLIEPDRIPGILERSNLTMREFADELLKTYSTSGKTLSQLSRIQAKLKEWKAANPEAAEALDVLEKKIPEPTVMQKFQDAYRVVDNPRRAIMVGQLMTFIRNVFSQGGRYTVEALDRGLEQMYGGKSMGEALETSLQFWSSLNPKNRTELDAILKEFPLYEEILRGNPTGELTQMGRLTRRLNWLNLAQEQFYRNATFDASLRNGLKQAGYNIEERLANPTTIPEHLVENAVKDAMEVTFAGAPRPGSWGARGLQVWHAFPFPMTTINPYPRFWANAADFIATHNPLSPLKLLMKDGQGEYIGANPKRKAEILAEGTTGSLMLAGAIALQQAGMRGGKWYQWEIGGQQIDLRAYAPFSTFMFMADLINTGLIVGKDALNGKTLKQALVANNPYTMQDANQAVLGINRIAGTGLIFTDVISQGSLDRKWDLLADFVSQYIGGFTVPLRTLKDGVAAFSEEEAKLRDVRDDLLGPAKANIPIVSQTLPEKPSPIEAEIPQTEHPALRQLTGLSVKTPNVVGREMDRLGIEFSTVRAMTGNPELDRAIDAETGRTVTKVIKPFVESPGYTRIKDPAVKRFFLESALSYSRTLATQQVKATHPDLAKDAKIDAVPKRVRDLILSMTGFDLEKAK